MLDVSIGAAGRHLRSLLKRVTLSREAGEIYVVTRHRRPIARIVPVEVEPVVVIPARGPGPSSLSSRPRSGMAPYEATEAAWAEMGTE